MRQQRIASPSSHTAQLWRCPVHGYVEDPHGAGECPHVSLDAPQGFCGQELTGPSRAFIVRRVHVTPAEHMAAEAERDRIREGARS